MQSYRQTRQDFTARSPAESDCRIAVITIEGRVVQRDLPPRYQPPAVKTELPPSYAEALRIVNQQPAPTTRRNSSTI